jgi:hypothetical protein
MLGQGTTVKRHCTAGRVSPADMVKAVLLEPQFPVVKVTTRRKKCLGSHWAAITAATLCIGMNRKLVHLRGMDIGQ